MHVCTLTLAPWGVQHVSMLDPSCRRGRAGPGGVSGGVPLRSSSWTMRSLVVILNSEPSFCGIFEGDADTELPGA